MKPYDGLRDVVLFVFGGLAAYFLLTNSVGVFVVTGIAAGWSVLTHPNSRVF